MKINKKLDYTKLDGLSADYYKKDIKNRSEVILKKIKKLKKRYGKKNSY